MWMVDPGAERALRDLADRGDIIKTMHRAMQRGGMAFDTSALALHRETPGDPIVGRLVARGLDDELAGSAFAIVDGVDGVDRKGVVSGKGVSGSVEHGGRRNIKKKKKT